jgi:D-alanyl-D-alanine carboxypeptidase
MTATLILQLGSEGRLRLDAPLTTLVPEADWGGLFVVDGADLAEQVTVEHLLSHTSGAADYFDGKTRAPRSFVDEITEAPDQVWTPGALLDYSRRFQRPVGRPGERFTYSDTGYVLLGRIIEETTSLSLGTALHQRVFDPSGMAQSCLLFRTLPGGEVSDVEDPAATLDIEPFWLDGHEMTHARSISCDWGGGGIVTTADDLIRFQDALHYGKLLPPESVAWMAEPRHRLRAGIRYGAGMMSLRFQEFFPLLRGLGEPVGHVGVLGTHMFWYPQHGSHVVLNFHSTREMTRSFRCHIRIAQLLARAAR